MVVKGLLFTFFLCASSSYGLSVSDIEQGYEKISDSLGDFKDEVEKLRNKYATIKDIVANEKMRQLEGEAMIKTTSDTFSKMGNESTIFVRAELLRGETSFIKNKELIFSLWNKSQAISQEDISRIKKDK